MSTNNENENGDGSSGDDLGLAADLDDWVFAGRGFFRSMERLGRMLPPFGPDSEAEVAHVIAAADGELGRLVDTWSTIIRPALVRHEDHPPTWMVRANGGDMRYTPAPSKSIDAAKFTAGALVDDWCDGARRLLAAAEKLRDCVPPADGGVAYSMSAYHLPHMDDLFERSVTMWRMAVRPALKRFERRRRT